MYHHREVYNFLYREIENIMQNMNEEFLKKLFPQTKKKFHLIGRRNVFFMHAVFQAINMCGVVDIL